jgi:hypothetical protein
VSRSKAARALGSLARIGRHYGPSLGGRKLALLVTLESGSLPTADQVLRLHEFLCLLDAYPDDRRVHIQVRRMLRAFRDRPDLRRHRGALAGTGIAGTDIPYRFFWPTARWLARSWPGALVIDRADSDQAQAMLDALPELLPQAQSEFLKQLGAPTLAALDRLRPRAMTDADWFISLVAAMPGDDTTREAYFDRIDAPFILRAGPTTPERTTARFEAMGFHPQLGALRSPRPDLRRESRRTPRRVVELGVRRARALIRLARASMVTRERDLAVFQYADARDAFLVEDGAGLAFAFVGMQAGRRLPLPAVYGGLTLQNGVPVGYVQLDLLGRHAELSFNQFATFRDGGAARAFARLVAITHHLFACDSFSIEPYQLGDGNDEGIASGAWWFYHHFGFRPRARQARSLAVRELRRARGKPGYRTPKRTLRRLARSHLYFSLDPRRRATLPRTATLLRAAAQALRRFPGSDARERRAAAAGAAGSWLGARGLSGGDARALADWAGIVLALARNDRWSRSERRGLLAVISAKSGAREREFLARLRRHARLRSALGC